MKTFTHAVNGTIFLLLFSVSCTKNDLGPAQLLNVRSRSGTATASYEQNQIIKVLTFNILAPCWADPVYYPVSTAPYLDRVSRRNSIIQLLKSNEQNADVIALQEVAQVEFNYLAEALGPAYVGFQANHASDYWSNWITASTPWELNGNAVFIKKEKFEEMAFEDLPVSNSGNHAALFTGIMKNAGGRSLRVASIHLDSDHAYNRRRELQAVLDKWKPRADIIDIIAGDLNTETDATNIQSIIKKAGYYDLLDAIGAARHTHPWDSKYYGSDNWGIIDHIISRNSDPVSGAVMDFNLFELFPKDEEIRIIQNLQLSGSDHFPVWGTMAR